jgi:ribosomal protein S18 acetylase RimI-like enzyme
MSTITQTIRFAVRNDASGLLAVHDAAWRESYRGIIQGAALEKMIEARGPAWWERSIAARNSILVLEFDGAISGYVSFGHARNRSERYPNQIYELYLKPEFQGVGFGRRLFGAARQALSHGRGPVAVSVWALSANERAIGFYQHLGGRRIGERSERIGPDIYPTSGFGFS